jgi:hypothetical protein
MVDRQNGKLTKRRGTDGFAAIPAVQIDVEQSAKQTIIDDVHL